MNDLPEHPSVAVIVPCLNERDFILPFLGQMLAQDYDPKRLEIYVCDGMSADGTRDLLKQACERNPRIHLVDNPGRTTARALNLGLKASRSDVVVRVDVHTDYPPTYVSGLVSLFSVHRADNVGALRLTHPGTTTRGHLFASLISAPFANGGVPWRSSASGIREVESVYCGCFPRSVFEKFGMFDESMIRIEDREFNARIRQGGGRILMDPSVTCTYYPRTGAKIYFKWTFSGPFRLFYSRRLTKTKLVEARNYAPLLFTLYHLALPFLLYRAGLVSLAPIALYLLLALGAAVNEARTYRCASLILLLPPLFYATHLVYGFGSLVGFVRSLLPLPPPPPEGKFSHT